MSRVPSSYDRRHRVIEGLPGTFTSGFHEQPIQDVPVPPTIIALQQARGAGRIYLRVLRMGLCSMILDREPGGPNGALLWHLSISAEHRHPTWDEIKVARYRLLPLDRTFAILLPPPEQYVNVPAQDHVFHLWETPDPRGGDGGGG